jgi:RHS repeat-associated protein
VKTKQLGALSTTQGLFMHVDSAISKQFSSATRRLAKPLIGLVSLVGAALAAQYFLPQGNAPLASSIEITAVRQNKSDKQAIVASSKAGDKNTAAPQPTAAQAVGCSSFNPPRDFNATPGLWLSPGQNGHAWNVHYFNRANRPWARILWFTFERGTSTTVPHYPVWYVAEAPVTYSSSVIIGAPNEFRAQFYKLSWPLAPSRRVHFELRSSAQRVSTALNNQADYNLFAQSSAVTVSGNGGGGTAAAPSPDWVDGSAAAAPAPAVATQPVHGVGNLEVGATSSTFRVDESGNSTYQIPLYTAPATGQLNPSLALVYSSAAGDGHVGIGWSLSGNSAITRCRKTAESGDGVGPHPPVNFTSSDQFCLDGMRLIQAGQGSDSFGAYSEFRTEITDFRVVRSYGAPSNPNAFVIWGKDGLQKFYGSLPSGIVCAGSCDVRVFRNLQGLADSSMTMIWPIAKIRDNSPAHSYMEFVYDIDHAKGEFALTRLNYSGSESPANTPTASVSFEYGFKAKPRVQFMSGAQVTTSKRLNQIISRNSDAQIVRSYNLSYEGSDQSVRQEKLTSIQECGLAGVCYPALNLAWSTNRLDYSLMNDISSGQFRKLQTFKFGDVNGDGLTDIVWSFGQRDAAQSIKISFAKFDAFGRIDFNEVTTLRQFDDNGQDRERSWHVLDFNQDGLDDLLILERPLGSFNGRWNIYLSNGNDFSTSAITLPVPMDFAGLNNTSSEALSDAQLADFNGDGLVDFLTPVVSSSTVTKLAVRYMRRATSSFSCTTLSTSNNCPYEFGPTEMITLESNRQLYFGRFDTEHYEAFDVNGDGLADLHLDSVNYSRKPGAVAADDYAVIAYEPAVAYIDFPEDTLPGPKAGGPLPVPPVNVVTRMLFVNKGHQSSGDTAFGLYGSWGNGNVGASDDDFRVADINGDGLADVFYRDAVGAGYYALNSGAGFLSEQCVLPLVGGGCERLDNAATLQLQDYDGDGALDLWLALEGDEPSFSLQNLCGAQGVVGSKSNQPYAIKMWRGNGFSGPLECRSGASGFGEDWLRTFVDFNGDGNIDNFGIRRPGNNSGGQFRINASQQGFVPRDKLQSLVNGLGNATSIVYLPMTVSDLYQRDYNAPFLTNYGHGSPVMDVAGTNYLTAAVASSAPTASNPNETSVVVYRYLGLKMQSGGRGSLGFRKVISFDPQTTVATGTEYLQRFPLIGSPDRTSTYLMRTTLPGQCSGGYGSNACIARAPVCSNDVGAAQLNYSCDRYIAPTSLRLGYALDSTSFSFKTSLSSADATNLPLLSSASAQQPAFFFVRKLTSSKSVFACNAANGDVCASISADAVERELTYFDSYDTQGNLTASRVTKGNVAGGYTQSSTFEYDLLSLSAPWPSGLLKRTVVNTFRGGISKVRESVFDYDGQQLIKEEVQPNGNITENLKTLYIRNAYGLVLSKVTCSQDYSDAACRAYNTINSTAIPVNVTAKPVDANSIRRYESTAYDASGRFVNATFAPFSVVGSSFAEARQTSAVVDTDGDGKPGRNEYGAPLWLQDSLGSRAYSAYTPMGAKYFNNVPSSGVSGVINMRWCATQAAAVGATVSVSCPAGAVYRVEHINAGAPTSWAFFDKMGREFLSVSESFNVGQFTAAHKTFDVLGRVVEQSDPYFVSSVGELKSCGTTGVYCARTSYDFLGRPIRQEAPESTITLPVVTLLEYGAVQLADSSYVSELRTINPKGQVQTEWKNGLGELVTLRDNQGLTVTYEYDQYGNATAIKRAPNDGNSAGVTITNRATYDLLSRKLTSIDPDTGTWSYSYNALGELVSQIDAKAQCILHRYDVRGRLIDRRDYSTSSCSGTPSSNSVWQFDSGNGGLGALATEATVEANGANFQRNFVYDNLGRSIEVNTVIDNRNYTQRNTFDQYSRPFQSFDLVFGAGSATAQASGAERSLGVQFDYDARGFQYRVRNAIPAGNNDVLYETLSVNNRGQVLSDKRGGNAALTSQRAFDPATGRLLAISSGNNGALQNLSYGGYDVLGNLGLRRDLNAQREELFSYDAMNRLKSSTVQTTAGLSPVVTNMVYDQIGNIMAKAGVSYQSGSLSLSNSCTRQAVGPHMVMQRGNDGYCYDANGNQISMSPGAANPNSMAAGSRRLDYTVFDKPSTIYSYGSSNSVTRYRYGPSREMIWRADGATLVNLDTQVDYVGNVEVYTLPNTAEQSQRKEYKRMIGGYLIINMQIGMNAQSQWLKTANRKYQFSEKLGSVDVIADQNGLVSDPASQCMSFDVWGNRRDASSWGAWGATQIAAFNSRETRHGYGGHEHIDSANIIHMGGRTYDPVLGRFMQADPVVQAPSNTQSFNRYSYVLNNPMNYTDPSGYTWLEENWRTVASVAISIWLPGGFAAMGANSFLSIVLSGVVARGVQSGSLRGALVGGLTAGMMHGIGSYFEGATWAHDSGTQCTNKLTTLGRAAKVASHSAAGGISSVLNGGKFGHGFASAGFAQTLAPTIDNIMADNPGGFAVRIIAAAVAGGTSSVIAGGKFANGAFTGAFSRAFNDEHLGSNGSGTQLKGYVTKCPSAFGCWGLTAEWPKSEPRETPLDKCQDSATLKFGVSSTPIVGLIYAIFFDAPDLADSFEPSERLTKMYLNSAESATQSKLATLTANRPSEVSRIRVNQYRADMKALKLSGAAHAGSRLFLKGLSKLTGPLGLALDIKAYHDDLNTCDELSGK